MIYGIDVVSIQSGPIQSQIWTKTSGALDEFKETDYGPMILKTEAIVEEAQKIAQPAEVFYRCLLYTSPSPRDATLSRMPSSA